MSDSNIVENNPASNLDLTQYLPAEMLQEILKKLPIKDVLAFAKTSKDARYIVNDDMLWKYLVDRDFSDFDKEFFSEYNKENRNYREQYGFLHKQKAKTDWSSLITTNFNDFDKKFFLNTTELASDYEKYKYLHTQKKQTLKRYREKFDELANNNLSEKNACLAIMLAFYPNAKNDIEYYKNKGATETEAQNLINNANSDNPILYNYTSYFNAFLQINFDINNNRIYDDINNNKALPLIHVVANNLKEHVDALIRAGADVFATDTDGDTAISCCNIDNPEIAKILIQAVIKTGKLEQPLDQDAYTPLIHATIFGLKDEIVALLNAGANVFATNNYGNTAIYFCRDNPDTAKILIQAAIKTGKLEQPLDHCAYTPLIYATSFGLKDEVTALLKAGANILATNKDGDTAISFCNKDNPDIAKILIQAVIKTGKLEQPLDHYAYTPLIHAAMFGLKDEVTALLNPNANVLAINKYGNTAIYFCRDNPDIAKILMQAVIKTGKLEQPLDHYAYTPLFYAAIFRLKDGVTALLKAGANPFATDKDGATAIYFCRDNPEIAKIIIQAVIKTDKLEQPLDPNSNTPIIYATFFGLKDEVTALLKAGANILATNKDGDTAITCCNEDNPDIAKILIQAVINTGKLEQPIDHQGTTILMFATQFRLIDDIVALLNAGANPFATNSYGNTAIYFCRDNPDIAKILMQAVIKTGKLEQPLDLYAYTPLIHAAMFGLKDEVTALLKAGANVLTTNKDGNTAIYYCNKDNPDIAKILIQAVIKTGKIEQPLSGYGNTALKSAAMFGLKDEVVALLDAGADIFATNIFGRTVFESCATKPEIRKIIFQAIIEKGKLDQLQNSIATTPFLIADIFEFMDELLQEIRNSKDKINNPPLLNAFNTLRSNNEGQSDTDNCEKTLSERPDNNRRYG